MMHPVRVNFQLEKLQSDNPHALHTLEMSFQGDMEQMNTSTKVWDGVPFPLKREFESKQMIRLAEMWLKVRLLFTEEPKGKPSDFFEAVKGSLNNTEIKNFDASSFDRAIEKLEITK